MNRLCKTSKIWLYALLEAIKYVSSGRRAFSISSICCLTMSRVRGVSARTPPLRPHGNAGSRAVILLLGQLFLPESAWRTVIPENAIYAAETAALKVPVGLDTWLPGDPWSIPYYTASAKTPIRPLLYNADAWRSVAEGKWRRFGNPVQIEKQILASSTDVFPYRGNVFSSISAFEWRLPPAFNRTENPAAGPARFRFSLSMKPSPGTDGHMAVEQLDGRVVETYATIVLSSGEIVALSYSITDPSGLGDGWQNGQTASMLPCYAGLIDDEELTSGKVPHAMAITIPAQLMRASIAYPAYAFDRDAATATPAYGGSIPMGARLALSGEVDINKLALRTPEGRAMAEAAKRYGFIVVDRGGEGISVRIRKNNRGPDERLHSGNWLIQNDLLTIFSHLHSVTSMAGTMVGNDVSVTK